IGYRSYRLAGRGERPGLFGFGSAGPLVCPGGGAPGGVGFALTRAGGTAGRELAPELGAERAGEVGGAGVRGPGGAGCSRPAREPVPEGLRALAPGGTVVCAGIHMSDIPSFPYEILWHERTVRSVANLTRLDGEEFLPLAESVPVRTEIHTYPLSDANRAL